MYKERGSNTFVCGKPTPKSTIHRRIPYQSHPVEIRQTFITVYFFLSTGSERGETLKGFIGTGLRP